MKANYHTHTKWCKHGTGEIEDFIEKAIEQGLKELAITEHVPHRDNLDFNRLQWEQFSEYDYALNKAIEHYENDIHVIKGFECEYYPEELDFYRKMKDDYGYELLILGQHRSGPNRIVDNFGPKGQKEIAYYVQEVCNGIKTGLFRFLAHPDLCVQGYPKEWDDILAAACNEIYSTCEKYHMPVEINANGIRNHKSYPSLHALKLSKNYQLEYVISSDAHHPENLVDWAVKEAERIAGELNLHVAEIL